VVMDQFTRRRRSQSRSARTSASRTVVAAWISYGQPIRLTDATLPRRFLGLRSKNDLASELNLALGAGLRLKGGAVHRSEGTACRTLNGQREVGMIGEIKEF